MNHKFTYKIETLATDSVKRFETHVMINHLGNTSSFYSGLYCRPDTYTNINRNSFSLDPVHYGFQKCFWFAHKWIEILLYDFYIQSLLDPNTELLKIVEQTITKDIEHLNKFNSFNHCYEAFLLDKFRNLDDEDPIYADYAPYHRLLDCMLDYQLRSRAILTKNSNNKAKFFKSIKQYSLQEYRFNLAEELKIFLTWTVQNNIALIDQHDPKWILDI